MDAIEVVKLAGVFVATVSATWAAKRADSAAKATGPASADGSLRDMVQRVDGKVDLMREEIGGLRDRVAVLEDNAPPAAPAPIPMARKALK